MLESDPLGRADDPLREPPPGPRAPLGDRRDGPRTGLGALIDQLDDENGEAAFETMYRTFFSRHAGPPAQRAVADATEVPLSVARAELASMAISTQAIAHALTQPVLWITAANADEERLSRIFGDVQFSRVVGSGHFPHIEVPDQINAMTERFIPTLPRRPISAGPASRATGTRR